MEYDNEDSGFISVPAPEFGAIFMSNIATKRDCLKHKVFGLPSSMANFVKEVKKGMVLFLFEYERRQLFGVYRAISDGGMNIVPYAFSSSGKQFSAQVQFEPIWYCSPLSENEFRDAIRENYFSARKFRFGLSDKQVHRLLRLFSSRKLKNKLHPRKLTTGVSNGIDEEHIMMNNKSYTASGGFDIKRSNVDLRPSLSRGYPRSFHGVKRVDDDMFSIEPSEKDEDIDDSAEHLYYNDKKGIGYNGTLMRDNAAEDKLHVHSLTEELGFSGDEWSSLNDRVKGEHKINMNYTPAISNFMGDSDFRRTAHDANLVVRDQMVKENNMDSNFCLGRSNEHNGKLSDSVRTRLGTHAVSLRNNRLDKAHIMDNSHEPSHYRKNKVDPFLNIGTVSDDWQRSLDDRVRKKSHLDPDINSTIVAECFVNSPYNQKGMHKDGRVFRREISGNESKFHKGLRREFHLRREFDRREATDDDVCFLSRRKGANEKCSDSFLISAASNGNSAYAGDVGRQMAEVGSYQMNDFDGLVPVTENFQRPLAVTDCTAYSPMKKITSEYSTKFLAETESHLSIEARNLGPSCSKFHDATITRVMPDKHEIPGSCYGHTETYEVEQGSDFVQRPPSNIYRENNFASSKGISSPYSRPEFTKRGLGSASEGGKMVLLQSHDGFNNPPLNLGISVAMEPNRSGSSGCRTSFVPRSSIVPEFTRDADINEGETWRFSSQAALGSIARNCLSGNCQCADEELGDEHVIWQGNGATQVGRRSRSPNTSWLLQGKILTNLDHADWPGAETDNDDYDNNILTNVVHSDTRNSRRSVFSRLSLVPKVRKLREQEVDSMSFDERCMDTTVDEIMELLYKDHKIVSKKPLNRKPFIRKLGFGESNRSGKHAAVVKNNTEQPGESMVRVLEESANGVLEETTNHVLTETRMVDFKRRRKTNQVSEQINAKSNKEDKTNTNEHSVLQNAQGNSSQTAVANDSADKPLKRRKLVRPSFDENNCGSGLNHQLPC